MFTDIANIDLPRSRRDTKASRGRSIVVWTKCPEGEVVRWQCKPDGKDGWYRRWADQRRSGRALWMDTNLWPQELKDLIVCGFDMPKAPRPEKPKPDVKAQRAAKAEADLARWQRRLKLAKTKVKQYERRVRYYDRKAAKLSESRQTSRLASLTSGSSTALPPAAVHEKRRGRYQQTRRV